MPLTFDPPAAVESEVRSTSSFVLGDWLVHPRLNRLCRDGESLQIRPKLMDVLALLASRNGEVVSLPEIIESVWAREFMAESVVTRTIAELRKVLGDKAAQPRFIETITKRGYRLVAPVQWTVPGPEAHHAPAPVATAARPAGTTVCCLVWGEREIALGEGENLIGRSREAVIRISSSRVSRCHARIRVAGGRAVLEDLESKNGTFLWGRRIQGPVGLSDGDEICVGRDVMIFRFCYPIGTTVTDTAM